MVLTADGAEVPAELGHPISSPEVLCVVLHGAAHEAKAIYRSSWQRTNCWRRGTKGLADSWPTLGIM
jgi:hypothetical protein